jgi:hypothetical protein
MRGTLSRATKRVVTKSQQQQQPQIPRRLQATSSPTATTIKSRSGIRWHGGAAIAAPNTKSISITFLQPDGETRTVVEALVGETLLQTAHRNEIDLEGACEGGTHSCILSTHISICSCGSTRCMHAALLHWFRLVFLGRAFPCR